jgi:hypothetical protein
MQATRGRAVKLLLILELGTRCEWSASRPSRALPPGKDPRYPLDRRLGRPQNRSGHRLQMTCLRDQTPVVQSVIRRYTE